jgi:hypothetical protein
MGSFCRFSVRVLSRTRRVPQSETRLTLCRFSRVFFRDGGGYGILVCFCHGFVTAVDVFLNLGSDVSLQQKPWWQFNGGTEHGDGGQVVWADDVAGLAVWQEAVFFQYRYIGS